MSIHAVIIEIEILENMLRFLIVIGTIVHIIVLLVL